jgi:hypothetical protein
MSVQRTVIRSRKPALSLPKGIPSILPSPAAQEIFDHRRQQTTQQSHSCFRQPQVGKLQTLKGPTMHRLTAKLLLLFALVGNLAPLALALTTANPHACCVRKAAHPCHDSAISKANQLDLRDARCCNHDCCRAVTTARWAQAQPSIPACFVHKVAARLGDTTPLAPTTEISRFQSTRAPPAC